MSIWYDLTDKQRYPGTRTRETAFPYSKDLAAKAEAAMDAVRSGQKVEAVLEFFQQHARIKLVVPGPGAVDEIDTSHSERDTADKRIRPLNMSFPGLSPA